MTFGWYFKRLDYDFTNHCLLLFQTEKDDHVLKAFIRHERRDLLEKLQDLPMTISFKLSSPISLDSYSSFSQASIFGKKASSINVAKGSTVPIYLSAPNVNDKYTKHALLGKKS